MLLAASSSDGQLSIPVLTSHNALLLQVNRNSSLDMIYFGGQLADENEYIKIKTSYRQSEDYSQVLAAAYPSSGAKGLNEPALSVTHSDGNNSLALKYVSHEINRTDANVSTLTILLKDPVYPFTVRLHYRIYFAEDVIEQWTTLSHEEKGTVTLHKFASAALYVKGSKFYLREYHGNKMQEMQPEEAPLYHGIRTLDTKLGTRANMFMSSAFMVSFNTPSTEDEGSVLLGALAYSGNFRLDFEVDQQDNLRIISGINNYASDYNLRPKELFETPAFVYCFSDKGKGEASRRLHRWARRYKLVDGTGSRLTILANPKVQDFFFRTVDQLFVQYPGLAYLKWDCNSKTT